jgi:hypothetical protein
MENNRLAKHLYAISRYYLIGVTVLFGLYALLVFYSYAHIDNIKNYCIHVGADGAYHFKVSEENACLIDWMYFIEEPLFLLILIYVVLAGPVWMAFYFLRKRLQRLG